MMLLIGGPLSRSLKLNHLAFVTVLARHVAIAEISILGNPTG